MAQFIAGACSVDKARLRKRGTKQANSEDDSDDSLPDRVQRQVDEAQPNSLNIFVSYKHTIYCAELKASDVAKKLQDGARCACSLMHFHALSVMLVAIKIALGTAHMCSPPHVGCVEHFYPFHCCSPAPRRVPQHSEAAALRHTQSITALHCAALNNWRLQAAHSSS